MRLIYHILARATWLSARENGEYYPENFSREGFIHFSQIHQLLGVAERFYSGQKDLVLLLVDVSKLKAELKYEPPDHPSATTSSADNLFPHLYGPLNCDAVTTVYDFEPDQNGKFSLPAELHTEN